MKEKRLELFFPPLFAFLRLSKHVNLQVPNENNLTFFVFCGKMST